VQELRDIESRAAAAQRQALAAAVTTHEKQLASALDSLRESTAARLASALAEKDALIAQLTDDLRLKTEECQSGAKELAEATAVAHHLRTQLSQLSSSSLSDRQAMQGEHAAAVRLMKDEHAAALASMARSHDAKVAQ
jgi:hypothetical protein